MTSAEEPGSQRRPTAIVYIDGLNLYRQKLAFHAHCKWLNPIALAELMLPTHDVRVRYFTTKVKPAAADAEAPVRQLIYWRALETLGDRLTIHEGKMRTDTRLYPAVPRAHNADGSIVKAKVMKVEEKGGDVALASYMVFDAATSPADLHVLMSSDSDFKPTLELIRNELGVAIGLFSPIEKPPTDLQTADLLVLKIVRRALLEASQFPDVLRDKTGEFGRPRSWA